MDLILNIYTTSSPPPPFPPPPPPDLPLLPSLFPSSLRQVLTVYSYDLELNIPLFILLKAEITVCASAASVLPFCVDGRNQII